MLGLQQQGALVKALKAGPDLWAARLVDAAPHDRPAGTGLRASALVNLGWDVIDKRRHHATRQGAAHCAKADTTDENTGDGRFRLYRRIPG